jgi:DNA-binding response OmpR family regulator
MLPTRAYHDPLPPFSAGARAEPSVSDARPALVLAVAAADVDRFPSAPYARFAARNTAEAIRLVERWRPRVVAIDWDLPDFDGQAICNAVQPFAGTGVLVTTTTPQRAPSALKCGCHAVLLKPFAPNLAAARVGRLAREMPTAAAASRLAAKLGQCGTNRTWPEVTCPKCSQAGAVSFEYSSHRRTWFACLACESVWLGRRQE